MPNFKQLHILVTRPDPAGSALCTFLKERGCKPIHFPTIQIAPPQDLSLLKEQIKFLGQQDWLIFISPQAVLTGLKAIHSAWQRISPHIHLAAIGEGTAETLRKSGYDIIAVPSDWRSEGLLTLLAFQNIKDKKIAIIKGLGGREFLSRELTQRGAHVTNIITYQRILPEIDTKPYFKLVQNKQIDIIICASFEGIQNLKLLFGKSGWPYIKNIPLVIPSERIKKLAHDLGFATILVTRNASHTAILEVLEVHYGR